jgi:hypothetical protein
MTHKTMLCALLATLATLATLTGCTMVDLTRAGEQVRDAQAMDVIGCERIGTATARTQDRVIVARNRDKVADELLTLGRNEAARLGGNVVVEQGRPENGAQVFDVYRCAD